MGKKKNVLAAIDYAKVFASGTRIKNHTLKIWPGYFASVIERGRFAELRRADRDFGIGDYLFLAEWVPEGDPVSTEPGVVRNSMGEFTGRYARVRITHIFVDTESKFLQPGIVMISFKLEEIGALKPEDRLQVNLLSQEDAGGLPFLQG